MAEALSEFDKIRGFAKALRGTKCNIDREFTVEVSPVLSKCKFACHDVNELGEGIKSMEEVLNSLNDISKLLCKIKDDFQEAKIQVLQEQLKVPQVRDQPGRSLGQRNDSGCFSVDSRILSTGSNLIVHPSDDNIEEESAPAPRSVTSLHTEPVQHEDISQSLNKDDDSTC